MSPDEVRHPPREHPGTARGKKGINRFGRISELSGGGFPLHPGGGVLGQLGGIPEVELLFDLLTVILDGFDAEMEFRRDFLGLLPAAYQLKNLQFAVAETFHRGFLEIGLPANLLL
jgi:hypothetical protein